MKKHVISLLLAGALFAPAIPALAFYDVNIGILNQTQTGAWITVYEKGIRDEIIGSYCVGPGEKSQRRFENAYKVIAEIKSQRNCHGSNLSRLASDTNYEQWWGRAITNQGRYSWHAIH